METVDFDRVKLDSMNKLRFQSESNDSAICSDSEELETVVDLENEIEIENEMSETVSSCLDRRIYTNSYNKEVLNLTDRPVDKKPLSNAISTMDNLFQPTSEIKWNSMEHIPGNHKCHYATLKGGRPMGMVKMEPGGYFKLHWHQESEHYLVVSGEGLFTVGTQENRVKIRQFPTLITIPGNVPHQTLNSGTEDLIWYYFFPEIDSIGSMRYFVPCYARTEVYDHFPADENAEISLKKIIPLSCSFS